MNTEDKLNNPDFLKMKPEIQQDEMKYWYFE